MSLKKWFVVFYIEALAYISPPRKADRLVKTVYGCLTLVASLMDSLPNTSAYFKFRIFYHIASKKQQMLYYITQPLRMELAVF